jgi:hypothetical protein
VGSAAEGNGRQRPAPKVQAVSPPAGLQVSSGGRRVLEKDRPLAARGVQFSSPAGEEMHYLGQDAATEQL